MNKKTAANKVAKSQAEWLPVLIGKHAVCPLKFGKDNGTL